MLDGSRSIGVLVLLLVGEVIGHSGLVDRSYLPPTSTVLAHVGGLVTSAGFLDDVAFPLGGWSSGGSSKDRTCGCKTRAREK
jgi:NitT/TauT family transport system permease protein